MCSLQLCVLPIIPVWLWLFKRGEEDVPQRRRRSNPLAACEFGVESVDDSAHSSSVEYSMWNADTDTNSVEERGGMDREEGVAAPREVGHGRLGRRAAEKTGGWGVKD